MTEPHRDQDGNYPTKEALESYIAIAQDFLGENTSCMNPALEEKLKSGIQMAETQLLIGAYSE